MTTTTRTARRGIGLRNPTRPPDRKTRTRSIAPEIRGAIADGANQASSGAVFLSGARAIAPVALALAPLGMAFGAAAMGSGLSMLQALGMSALILSGAAQLAALPLVSADASVAVVVLTVLVINLRFVLYSASLAPHFKNLSAGWKALLSYLIIDQAYAEAITRFERGEVAEHARRWYFLGVTLPIVAVWLAGTVGGVYLGSWVSEGWSLDFVLPLIFIALAVPAVKNRATGAAALFAGVTALFAASMPLNLGLLTAALVGVSGGLVAESVIGRRDQ
ncbi:MAG TPA: AzlC family ABC transporter permease [Rubrobacter sp.]|nr:AzlC family ABC transporter permease [Rubrobacter sp.]